MRRLLATIAIVVAASAGAPLTGPTVTAAPLRSLSVAEPEAAAETSAGHDHDHDHVARLAVHVRPSVTVHGADAVEREQVDVALARFRDAGLLLPDLVVEFHDDDSVCQGHDGLFRRRFVPFRVLICNGAEYVLTHELAHAWEAANLDDADRDEYRRYRGLATWNSSEHPRGDRAVEDVAFTVQQNLMARHADPTAERWADLIDAYEVLTGTPSPLV